MTAQQDFYGKLTALATLCSNFVLSRDLISIYDSALSSLGYERAARAVEHVILTRNSRDPFPSVRELRSVVDPEQEPADGAAMISAAIFGAVSRIGPYNTQAAREALGEVAWKVVQSEGGWQTLCEAVRFDNATTYKAQWRRLAEALLRSKESSAVREAIATGTPHPLNLPIEPGANSLLKRIAETP
jgi:hypothetical protein